MEKTNKTSKELIKAEREKEQLVQAQTDSYRAQVQYRELIARSNKAEFEIMDYYIKASAIEDQYRDLMQKEAESRKQLQADIESQIATQVEEQNQPKEVPVDEEV